MLEHVFERSLQARYLTAVVIATDDERIAAAARGFGAPVRMTRADHLTGTDRVAEVASADTAELIVNIQGDEPLIDPAAIDAAILPLMDDEDVQMGTLKKRIEDPREIGDPNVVKVVTDGRQRPLFFPLDDSVCAFEGALTVGSNAATRNQRTTNIWLVRLPPRFSAGIFRPAGGTARTSRAAGAVARARKRLLASG